MKHLTPLLALPLLAATAAAQDSAQDPASGSTWDSVEEALGGGNFWLKFRYRYENVDQDSLPDEARASTLRTVLGYETASHDGFTGLIEFEDVTNIGRDLYNDRLNGETDRPIVDDSESTEVNQVYAQYTREEGHARLGRQRIVLDNHRFVGNVGWRQNEQTFDAATASWGFGPVNAFYGYVDNANRIFGDDSPQGDHEMDTHLVNLTHEFEHLGKLSTYGYLIDNDDADNLSTDTFGARFAGERHFDEFDLLYTAEYAMQSDSGDNPNDVDADYMLLELGGRMGDFDFTLSRELLEGSGDPGDKFTTPLATLHAFNGWADIFVPTVPDTGLEDIYASLGVKIGKASKLTLVYHDFQSDSGSLDYGTEFDARFVTPLRDNISLGFKAAFYNADDFASDTEKLWFWVSISI